MIYYFTGSGNSRAIAQALARLTSDQAEKVGGDSLCGPVLGLVLPVYSWGIAPMVLKWLQTVEIPEPPEYVYAVLDYGDEAGWADRILAATMEKRGLKADALFGLQMPNTYTLLPGFNVDHAVIAQSKLVRARARLPRIAEAVNGRYKGVNDLHIGPLPWVKTRLVYPLFRRWGIFPKKWRCQTDFCIRCGSCARACPVANIRMVYGHPEWGSACTSCLGCYHACPSNAVQYGRLTSRKGQWRHWFQPKVKPLDSE